MELNNLLIPFKAMTIHSIMCCDAKWIVRICSVWGLYSRTPAPGGPGPGTLCRISKHRTTPPRILILNTARCLDMVVQYKQRTLLETFMLSHFRYLCAANTAYTCGPKIFRQFCPINSDCLYSQMILNIFFSLFTIKWIHSLVLPYEAFIHFYFSPEKETALLENFLFLSTFI